MVLHGEVSVQTRNRDHWVDITDAVAGIVSDSGIANGVCTAISLHTTAGLTVNENADPDVEHDFFQALAELIPQNQSFQHSEGNSDSHVKASLVGLSVQLPVINGTILLGIWQSVYFCEFDGPRSRRVSVTVIGE
ncbi:MAG: secondary thiamine-phosphate synthase enzyme YjbQ [Chitinispirillaceae bacterium]|jgi:secondary thiamine-phosphate synthase enzyme|nr:secondary thiamine-phosphate synthase enzyme YjbQ [Chitinispirillaceae bacterium]